MDIGFFDESMYSESEKRNIERAHKLAAKTEFPFVLPHSLGHKWKGYDIFYTESAPKKEDGPILLVNDEGFRWIPIGSDEEKEIDTTPVPCF